MESKSDPVGIRFEVPSETTSLGVSEWILVVKYDKQTATYTRHLESVHMLGATRRLWTVEAFRMRCGDV